MLADGKQAVAELIAPIFHARRKFQCLQQGQDAGMSEQCPLYITPVRMKTTTHVGLIGVPWLDLAYGSECLSFDIAAKDLAR